MNGFESRSSCTKRVDAAGAHASRSRRCTSFTIVTISEAWRAAHGSSALAASAAAAASARGVVALAAGVVVAVVVVVVVESSTRRRLDVERGARRRSRRRRRARAARGAREKSTVARAREVELDVRVLAVVVEAHERGTTSGR